MYVPAKTNCAAGSLENRLQILFWNYFSIAENFVATCVELNIRLFDTWHLVEPFFKPYTTKTSWLEQKEWVHLNCAIILLHFITITLSERVFF